MRRLGVATLVLALSTTFGACATFGTVRSADVRAGPSFASHASYSTPPGDVAGWLWSFDCVDGCSHSVPGADLGYTYGWRAPGTQRAIAVSAGLSGLSPYVDGYVQLASGARPFGLGARIGLPVFGWGMHQLYARYDIPLSARKRLLVNPAVLLHRGESPNGGSSGHFLGFSQGLGIELQGKNVTFTPAVTVIAGRAQRDRYGIRDGNEGSVFATASLGLTFHRASPAKGR